MKHRDRRTFPAWPSRTLLALAVLTASALQAATVTISGSVSLQYQSDHGGAVVTFQPGPPPAVGASTVTSATGYYELKLEGPAGYTMTVTKPGYYNALPQQVYFYRDSYLGTVELAKMWTTLAPGYTRHLALSREESPYVFGDGVIECDSLTLAPGCRFNFTGGPNGITSKVLVNRVFTAVGNVDDSIYADVPSDIAWSTQGFIFRGGTGDLQFCNFNVPVTLQSPVVGAHAAIQNSHFPLLSVPDSSVRLDVRQSALESAVRYFVGVLDSSRILVDYSGLTFRGTATNSLFDYYWTWQSRVNFLETSRVEACTLRAGQVTSAGAITRSVIAPGDSLIIKGPGSLTNSIVSGQDIERGAGVRLTGGAQLRDNSLSRVKLKMEQGSIARANAFDCWANSAANLFFGSIRVVSNASFEGNHCFNYAVVIDSAASATGNIVVSNQYYGQYLQVNDYGTAVNNISVGGYNCITAGLFASVHHNLAWAGAGPEYWGIPNLGVNVKFNSNGDPCDEFFNLTLDPMITQSGSTCDVVPAGCTSPVFNAGDRAYGSRHIGFPDSTCMSTDVREVRDAIIPSGFSLEQNLPNPFNVATDIHFATPVRTHVRLEVMNILGQSVAVLFDGTCNAGHYVASWDGKDVTGQVVSSGIYLYRITAASFVETRKMVLLK